MKSLLLEKLDILHVDMIEISMIFAQEYPLKTKSNEMLGAANIVTNWINEIKKELKSEDKKQRAIEFNNLWKAI